jgi:hypothetical protein
VSSTLGHSLANQADHASTSRIEALLSEFKYGEEKNRYETIRLLSLSGSMNKSIARDIVGSLSSQDLHIQIYTIAALYKWGHLNTDTVSTELDRIYDLSDQNNRLEVIKLIREIDELDYGLCCILGKGVLDDVNSPVFLYSISTIAQIDNKSPQLIDVLVGLTKSSDVLNRRKATLALSKLGRNAAAAKNRMIDIVRDFEEDECVVMNAIYFLGIMGKDAFGAIDALEERLAKSTGSWRLQSETRFALKKIKGKD